MPLRCFLIVRSISTHIELLSWLMALSRCPEPCFVMHICFRLHVYCAEKRRVSLHVRNACSAQQEHYAQRRV